MKRLKKSFKCFSIHFFNKYFEPSLLCQAQYTCLQWYMKGSKIQTLERSCCLIGEPKVTKTITIKRNTYSGRNMGKYLGNKKDVTASGKVWNIYRKNIAFLVCLKIITSLPKGKVRRWYSGQKIKDKWYLIAKKFPGKTLFCPNFHINKVISNFRNLSFIKIINTFSIYQIFVHSQLYIRAQKNTICGMDVFLRSKSVGLVFSPHHTVGVFYLHAQRASLDIAIEKELKKNLE